MRRLLPSGLTGVALSVVLLVVTASGSALAYFTTTGKGNASAAVSKLTGQITANGGTISGTPLAVNSSGPAETATQFTYTAPASGNFSNTITAATASGTTYTSATMTASK